MAGIGRGTRGIDTQLFYNLTANTIDPTKFTLPVGDVTDIGGLTDTAGTTEVNVYGQGYTNTFTTIKNMGAFECEFLANSEDTGQLAIEQLYASQNTASFCVRLRQGTKQTDIMFSGQVSSFSVNQSADDVVRYGVSIVIHGAATKVHKA
tara:strand:+ start:127 stop:576 length:450 start_codon:yes stop_codon:yes gene_type:complete